jgi:hypothetical protein
MSRREELKDALHSILNAIDLLPDEAADKIYLDCHYSRAKTLEELRTIAAAIPAVYKASNSPGDADFDWVHSYVTDRVHVVLYHEHVLGSKPEPRPKPDLSLLTKGADLCPGL